MQQTFYHQISFNRKSRVTDSWIALNYQDNILISINISPEQINKTNLLSTQPALFSALNDYLRNFNPKIKPKHLLSGTEFQLATWRALDSIPIGTTITYTELAKQLNSHPRAIGQALRKNPLPLLYPCHRVISKIGIGGFAGETQGKLIKIKQSLLNFEEKIT